MNEELRNVIFKQLNNLFGLSLCEEELLKRYIDNAAEKSIKCIQGYSDTNSINPFYSDHYVVFLYFLSNILYQINDEFAKQLSDKCYLLNTLNFSRGSRELEKCF